MRSTTIAAVSTPRGKGGVAVIRLSGPEAPEVLDRCFRAKSRRSTRQRTPRLSAYGEIVSPLTGEIIDTGLATFFPGPASYTGEDCCEISCHGGVSVTEAVLSAAFAGGAEPAGPGEFTRRAYVAGKLSLSEAEAIGRLIDADTESRRKLASAVARGALTEKITLLGDRLSTMLSALWAAIDYPEEDVGEEGLLTLESVVCEVEEGVAALLGTYRTGRAIMDGIPSVICGRPNAGKSALYNALLGTDRAIVTAIPGTTRDVLEDTVDLCGITLRLSDTAGLRETEDAVEEIGVARAREAIRGAELILLVIDGSKEPTAEDLEEYEKVRALAPDAVILGVLSKADLTPPHPTAETWLGDRAAATVSLSSVSGEGMEDLKRAIGRLWQSELLSREDGALVFDARQKASLERAAAVLSEIREAIRTDAPPDVLGVLAETALSELRLTDGRGVSEEIVDGIFARFCVGK